jgi:divalent metal cation (Fe/Co/Zn/Cd) transporter
MVAGGFALFSLYYASRPQDEDHPYGHGKIEFLSAGFEGGLILIAGLTMIGKAIYGFFHPPELEALPTGIALTAVSGAINGGLGSHMVRLAEQSARDIKGNNASRHVILESSRLAIVQIVYRPHSCFM